MKLNYEPLIKDMVWSYSRIKSFDDCPYRWYLRYIRKYQGADMFFSSYGSFMHKLIEIFYTGGKTPDQLCDMYLQGFKKQVSGKAPSIKVFRNYFISGLQYLKNIQSFPYTVIAVEKRVDFEVSGIPFVGYIDFLGEKNGDIYVVDNKSRALKHRSKRDKPTKTDMELDSYLMQLYLYAAAIEQEYKRLPKALCFNCFRSQTFIEESFSNQAYNEAKQWVLDKVTKIKKEADFNPDVEFFKCTHLCEMQRHCEYYKLSGRGLG